MADREKFETVDEYIQNFPEEVQEILQKIRALIKKTSPKAVEAISYQIVGYKLDNKVLIYFAAFTKHIGIYPINGQLLERFKKESNPYLKGKATLQFSLNQPIPYDLIEKIVKFQAKAIETK